MYKWLCGKDYEKNINDNLDCAFNGYYYDCFRCFYFISSCNKNIFKTFKKIGASHA